MKLSCWLPYSWANQCCPVHMTHDSTMTTTAPVLRNRSREWFSQQASGPLHKLLHCNILRVATDDYKELVSETLKEVSSDYAPWHHWDFAAQQGFLDLVVSVLLTCGTFWHCIFDLLVHAGPIQDVTCQLLTFDYAHVALVYDIWHFRVHRGWN